MIRVRFVGRDGHVHEATARDGERLLRVAQAAGQPLEGTCEGQLACATCHVIVDAADVPRLTPAREEEEDMLDLAFDLQETSRLGCQIVMSEALDGLVVKLPAAGK